MRINKDNTPSSNNAYDLGSSSYQWANVFSRAMTIGREGYEWDINTNDGYVTLPSNVLINWGILPKASSVDYTSVNFGQSYSNPPAVFVTWEHTSNKTGDCFQYIKSGSVTTSRFQITRSDLGYTYWIAIGKRKV